MPLTHRIKTRLPPELNAAWDSSPDLRARVEGYVTTATTWTQRDIRVVPVDAMCSEIEVAVVPREIFVMICNAVQSWGIPKTRVASIIQLFVRGLIQQEAEHGF